MSLIFDLALLLILFFILSRAADLVVERVRKFSSGTNLSIASLGLLLGLLTSLPEMSVALNASIQGSPEVSIGNLLGGILVVFGLIHGGGIILNRRIQTNGSWWIVVLMFLYLSSFAILGLDGSLTRGEGWYLTIGYFLVATSFYVFGQRHKPPTPLTNESSPISIKKELGIIFVAIATVIGAAHFIMNLSLSVFTKLGLPELLIGLLVFSIGTNLPEIVITFQSWRRHIRDLSVSYIFGSVIVNGLIAGVSSIYEPIAIHADLQYGIIVASIVSMGAAYTVFFKSDHNLSRSEGAVLVLMFLAFFILQVVIA